MTPGTDDFSKWKEIRRQGPVRFILLRGMLGWGIATAVLYTLFMWLLSDLDPRRLVPLALTLFPLGGLLWGAFMWWFIERRYRQQGVEGDAS